MIYLLDACAVIAFLDKEAEGVMVKKLFDRTDTGKITIYISVVNLVEVFYHFIKKTGEEKAVEIMRKLDDLPLDVIYTISRAIYCETAHLKARYSISLGDVFLCATAKSFSATVVTKDHEIEAVEQSEHLSVLWIR
ncbi:MAG: type II toxin-antitoxin system VapC family toxin [Treponema sp.]|jgi:predicted nucleic acid-binding protein|nr:type II toxin-antitoxin system VapC family toxin [Treponema sp.]